MSATPSAPEPVPSTLTSDQPATGEPLLKVEDLTIEYHVGAGVFRAVQEVSFELHPGRVLGIVGETGCGKSTLAHAIPRLLPEPPAKIRSGKIVYQGVDLAQVPKWQIPRVRGTGVGMIFQEPINSLNPSYRIYSQIVEAIRVRRLRDAGKMPSFHPGPQPFDYSRRPKLSTAEAMAHPLTPVLPSGIRDRGPTALPKQLREEVLDYLRLVRINDPETILSLYPHELSGGMRQRVMIAMALSQRPTLLIADEPTSALDVTIQAQVLSLMKELMEEVKTSILFISHDLGVVAEMADEVGVMYAGHLVELGPVDEVFRHPGHPYTRALLESVPTRYKDDGPLPSLGGSVPNLSRLPSGCPFHPRCPIAEARCAVSPGPPLAVLPGKLAVAGHASACYFPERVGSPP
ncbi:MAG: ABC transporter ATP-binding protein [Thermoplasmata archaeon]|nr:ABC transporter ATP-binding protein [Thermoplasmata archaeon]